jgi:hypothetical protein
MDKARICSSSSKFVFTVDGFTSSSLFKPVQAKMMDSWPPAGRQLEEDHFIKDAELIGTVRTYNLKSDGLQFCH